MAHIIKKEGLTHTTYVAEEQAASPAQVIQVKPESSIWDKFELKQTLEARKENPQSVSDVRHLRSWGCLFSILDSWFSALSFNIQMAELNSDMTASPHHFKAFSQIRNFDIKHIERETSTKQLEWNDASMPKWIALNQWPISIRLVDSSIHQFRFRLPRGPDDVAFQIPVSRDYIMTRLHLIFETKQLSRKKRLGFSKGLILKSCSFVQPVHHLDADVVH